MIAEIATAVAGATCEYDVRRVGRWRWYVSDDDNRRFYGFTLARAVRKANKANLKGAAR